MFMKMNEARENMHIQTSFHFDRIFGKRIILV